MNSISYVTFGFKMNKLTFKVLIASFYMLAASFAHAGLVNGSLEGNIQNGALPTGWFAPSVGTLLPNTPDTMNELNNVGVLGTTGFAATPSASPNGGSWVGVGADGSNLNESFAQTISDFSIGTLYTLSWYDANFGVDYSAAIYTAANSFSAYLDDILIGTGSTRDLAPSWALQTFSFTPTATTHTLKFQLASTAKSYLSIDGISLTPPVTAVPEPQTWALMIAGLFLIGFQTRRRAS
jgi:hypothetical protein